MAMTGLVKLLTFVSARRCFRLKTWEYAKDKTLHSPKNRHCLLSRWPSLACLTLIEDDSSFVVPFSLCIVVSSARPRPRRITWILSPRLRHSCVHLLAQGIISTCLFSPNPNHRNVAIHTAKAHLNKPYAQHSLISHALIEDLDSLPAAVRPNVHMARTSRQTLAAAAVHSHPGWDLVDPAYALHR
jgi:hypothetical protein